ncbi:WecB/TagA/CpsF family glycosyltransferase [Pseudoalteromonas sp. P1-25]|uniref:WecB/TagA/CpsF family glycosyltransferase n=1 Tax=Pseudoalteromonas sp. P1-25 TaxID=1723758 RepID=UPI0006D668FD|nr:WecB/TagA/CpsF family glycosyltransferase [Pseudoalteromonas sp. P1-25]KPZ51756.1 UDP-Gal:alpha-D-GlcNAc-diphosphoundecaprenol beta-1,4-galactosyltransferase [Pseudoalteromonas sp. P1-25]
MKIIQFMKTRYVDVKKLAAENRFKSGAYIYVNPFNYMFLRKRPDITEVAFYRSDGIYLITILKAFLPKSLNFYRQSFDMTSLAPIIFEHCQRNNLSIFIAGGKEGDASKFISRVNSNFPDIKWKGDIDGYASESVIIEQVLAADADVVILGLGNIKQERVAAKLATLKEGLYFTCGAFISQTANSKTVDYYPNWVNKYNLRWLYRFFTESHVIKRVINFYPKFLFVFLKDLFFASK